MDVLKLLCALLVLSVLRVTGGSGSRCGFQAIYNFGDSNSDTGTVSAAFSELPPPNGESFFGRSSGRFCDGRLVIDFIAEKMKLPYLSPYLDSVGTNFRHGANFAAAGSSIRPGGYSPFHLGVQLSQFQRFKSRSIALYKQPSSNSAQRLPRPEEFSRALYTIDIGQNDLGYGFQHGTIEQVRASIPDILTQLEHVINTLYKEGARFFWVHNTGPHGCLPINLFYDKSKPRNLDQIGCVKSINEVTREFNRQLKDRVVLLRKQLTHAVFTYVDMYTAKYAVVSNAKNEGFVDPFGFCCGSYEPTRIDCGKKAIVNGTVYGNSCRNPSKHISWDGIHYSQAANILIANQIMHGTLSEPPVSITEACHG